MISRNKYIEKIRLYKDLQIIKVITGIRRCGKSTLLNMYQDDLLKNGVGKNQIIYINLEDKQFESLKNENNLFKYIQINLKGNMMNYIFIDEVQECNNFQLAINSLFLKNNVDIYLTGSNAHMLSSELATLLSGRYVEINVLPLSFEEYIQERSDVNFDIKFRDYLRFGSFPFILQFNGNEEQIMTYLDGLYNTIFKKDIMLKNNFINEESLENVTKFIFENIGNLTSSKK